MDKTPCPQYREGARVRSLIRELRFHMPRVAWPIKNKKKRKEIEGKEVGRGTQRTPHRGGGRQDKTQRLPRSTSYIGT